MPRHSVSAVSGLPPGRYVILLWAGGASQEMLVNVPASGVVAFKSSEVNALEIEIEHSSGELGRAGARTGDKLVAVEGAPIAGRSGLRRLLSEHRSKDRVRVTLLRGAEEFEIEVDRVALVTGEAAGAVLSYAMK